MAGGVKDSPRDRAVRAQPVLLDFEYAERIAHFRRRVELLKAATITFYAFVWLAAVKIRAMLMS